MKKSLSDGSGYFEIDHRDSPGLSPEDVQNLPGAVAVGGGQRLERDIQQCSHCQRGVLLNPGRVRARAHCPKCYHYICDECDAIRLATGQCVTFAAQFDTLVTLNDKLLKDPNNPDLAYNLDDLLKTNPMVVVPNKPDNS